MEKVDFKEQRIMDAMRRKKRQIAVKILVVVAILAALAYGLFWYVNSREANLPGVLYPDQGREHKELGYQFTYNSNPPTSGPHFASPANWTAYDYEVQDGILLHNMEHGGIWISYKPSVSQGVVEELKKIMEEMDTKVVLAPRSQNDTDIAVAAWTHLLKFDLSGGALSASQTDDIKNFIRAFVNRGPEYIPNMGGGIDPRTVQ